MRILIAGQKGKSQQSILQAEEDSRWQDCLDRMAGLSERKFLSASRGRDGRAVKVHLEGCLPRSLNFIR